MTKQERIKAAVDRIPAHGGDVAAAYREAFGGQVTPARFRRCLDLVRELPEGVREKIAECAEMNAGEAFRHCVPDYVSLEDLVQAAASRSEQAPAQPPPETPERGASAEAETTSESLLG